MSNAKKTLSPPKWLREYASAQAAVEVMGARVDLLLEASDADANFETLAIELRQIADDLHYDGPNHVCDCPEQGFCMLYAIGIAHAIIIASTVFWFWE